MSLFTTPRTWANGEFVTETLLNEEIRDPLTAIQAPWTSWTPTVSQGGVRTSTTTYARFHRVGKTISGAIHVVVTEVGSAGSLVSVAAPISGNSDPVIVGSMEYIVAASGVRRVGLCYLTGGAFYLWLDGQTNAFGVTPSQATAVDDSMLLNFQYEIA